MNHERKIQVHLEHAKRKHQHFADALTYEYVEPNTPARALSIFRDQIAAQIRDGKVYAKTILNCELAEVYEAIAAGRAEDAIEEIYDAVAVLLRMAEWVNEKGCK